MVSGVAMQAWAHNAGVATLLTAQSRGALSDKCILSENSKIEKSKRTVWKSGIYLVYNWMICPRNVKKCLNFCCFHLDTCPDAMQLFRLPFRPTAPDLAKDVWVANLHYPYSLGLLPLLCEVWRTAHVHHLMGAQKVKLFYVRRVVYTWLDFLFVLILIWKMLFC